ncbi:MAG: nicotinate phosphoribosyltransferase [Bacillus thermozeamaize]|uniref:Nicotinate phosphoribosyltransferase n=1 Tax=Bacillus thermozeamaize TaxID=230954 RepID=A0A1Y3PQN9_9BACI|nr:MAG: nicotinate phosphoribosyltransferase [Bacillus thermozeamaize]
MMHGYFKEGKADQRVVFDLFYRQNPCGNGYAIAAGLEQVIEYIQQLHFSKEEIDYLRSLKMFEEDFLQLLRNFRFQGDLYAIPEGTVVFPNEPLIRIEARIIEAQLLETALLNIVNHQTLIATKAARIVKAAGGKPVLEFGSRRAQGMDAALYGARAAMIGGCEATSNTLAGKRFGIPVRGTHAHSWVLSFPSELEAFRAYARTFPDNCLLLVDTYDTLRSGLPNAIRVAKELREQGHRFLGIRLDSGDLAYLSKVARRMLDEAGFPDAIIVASSDLNEEVIADLRLQGAKIDVYGVGTSLITSEDCPSLGGVYKLAAEEHQGKMIPKIKISENTKKITTPGIKQVTRIYLPSGMATADLIHLIDEEVDPGKPLELFDPVDTWKRKTVERFTARPLLVPVFIRGELVYQSPSVMEIQAYAKQELSTFSEEIKRLINPHTYHVDLSHRLWELKNRLILEGRNSKARGEKE